MFLLSSPIRVGVTGRPSTTRGGHRRFERQVPSVRSGSTAAIRTCLARRDAVSAAFRFAHPVRPKNLVKCREAAKRASPARTGSLLEQFCCRAYSLGRFSISGCREVEGQHMIGLEVVH